jgi:hypothetical protein
MSLEDPPLVDPVRDLARVELDIINTKPYKGS